MQRISCEPGQTSFPIAHHKRDDHLYEDLNEVLKVPKPLISHLVASRTKQDRNELQRILKHLPMIRESRTRRDGGAKSSKSPPLTPSAGFVAANVDALSHAQDKVAQRQTPKSRISTPRELGSRTPTPRPGTPQVATPRLGTPQLTTPRASIPHEGTPRGSVIATGNADTKALLQKSGAPARVVTPLSNGSWAQRREREETEAQETATQRVTAQLAELGIDPEGMTAGEVLQMLYARGSGSSYYLMNRDAAVRCNVRVQTPRSFGGVLSAQANGEVRRARDMPATNVHECLDHWEIEFLADVCRSLKHFDEVSAGPTSEYTRNYCGKVPPVPRKKLATSSA